MDSPRDQKYPSQAQARAFTGLKNGCILIQNLPIKFSLIDNDQLSFISVINNNNFNKYDQLFNKTVLLRERKRHTARRVASTPATVLSWGVEVHHLGLGYPTPQEGTWEQSLGYPPQKGHGTRGSIMEWRWGNPPPPPPPGVNRQTPVKTLPSRRTTNAGGKNFHNTLSK